MGKKHWLSLKYAAKMVNSEKLCWRGRISEVGDTELADRGQIQVQSFYLIQIDILLDEEQLFGTNRLGKIRCKKSGFLPPCYFNQYNRSIFHIFCFSSHFWLEVK